MQTISLSVAIGAGLTAVMLGTVLLRMLYGQKAERREVYKEVLSIHLKIDKFMSQVSDQLGAINAQLTKSFGEIRQKISDLESAITNNQDNLSPESQAALDALKATAQQLDDIVPDAPAPEPAA